MGDALNLEPVDDNTLAVGRSRLRVIEDPDAPTEPPLSTPGYGYITLQVDAVDAAFEQVLARGGREGSAPQTLGDVARIAFGRELAAGGGFSL